MKIFQTDKSGFHGKTHTLLSMLNAVEATLYGDNSQNLGAPDARFYVNW